MSNHPRRRTSRPWAPTAPPSAPFVLPEAIPAPPSTPSSPRLAEIILAASAAVAEPGPAEVPKLIARLADTAGWVARASLAVVARLALELADRELADLEVRARDEPLPAWAERFDDVVVSAAVQLPDPLGDADLLLLELRWPEAEPIAAVLLIDHNLGSTIKVGAVLERSIDALLTSFDAQAPDEPVRRTLTSPEARSIIEAAGWQPSARGASHLPAGEVRPLVEWLIARLPAGGVAPVRPVATAAERRAIRDRFFDSTWGRALKTSERIHVMDALLDLASDGDDPLRWSRARVGHLDIGALHDDPWFDPADLSAVPDLLRALIGFAHEQRGLARCHTDSAMAEVERVCWPLQAEAMADREASVPVWTWPGERLDALAGQVGSRATLASLDLAPLPDEPFAGDGILPEVLPAVQAILTIVDDVCDRFFDTELRTAARRLLATLARRSGTAMRGRSETTAAGIVWLVATASRAFDRHGVRQKDVCAHLGLSSSLSSRADALQRVLADGRGRRQGELGDAGFLTSAQRTRIADERDRLLADAEWLKEAVGW